MANAVDRPSTIRAAIVKEPSRDRSDPSRDREEAVAPETERHTQQPLPHGRGSVWNSWLGFDGSLTVAARIEYDAVVLIRYTNARHPSERFAQPRDQQSARGLPPDCAHDAG